MSLLKRHRTLEELEEENQEAEQELSLAKKRALIKRLEQHRGKGAWRMFTSTGNKSGIDWQRLRFKA